MYRSAPHRLPVVQCHRGAPGEHGVSPLLLSDVGLFLRFVVKCGLRGKPNMTPTEVLSEIQKLPLNDVRQVAHKVTNYLREQEQARLTAEEIEAREDEFERYLLSKGIISDIPTRNETDEDDDFEPIVFEGEPLSEMIIRERR